MLKYIEVEQIIGSKVIDREVSTVIMMIILIVQIIVGVIVNEIQTAAVALVL